MTGDVKKLEVILLVEDEQDHAELIIKGLKQDGHLINEIKWVKNGQEAIDYITQSGKYNKENAPRPELVLLDIKLPKKNGFQVLQEIKSDEGLKTIPVVMLTTTSVSEDIEKALKLGALNFLPKRAGFEGLPEMIEKVFEIHQSKLERGKKDKKAKDHIKNIELLTKTAMQFVEFPHDKNIYTFIGEQLQEFTSKDSYIIINFIDNETNILTTRSIVGMGKLSEKVASLLGKHPVGMTYDAKNEDIDYLSDGKLYLYKKGLYGISLKTIPKMVSSSIEKLLNIKTIFTIGFSKNNELFGTVIIALKKDTKELQNKQIIETFIKQASIAIQKKWVEKALKESKETLTQAIQGISIPTFIINNTHTITHWNNACENLTGFSKAEMVGTKNQWRAFYDEEKSIIADFIVDGATEEEMNGYYGRKYHKSILIKGAYEGENFFPTLGKKGKWLFYTAAPLRDHNGDITGAIETFQDLTESKSTEAQLRQAQKMESVGRLAGGVAHDFNNALSVITGFAEMALDDADPEGQLHEDLSKILTAANRAADITRQLLAFARKQTITPKVLDLNENVETMLKMLRRLIGEDINLVWLPGVSLWSVKLDPSQIDQVLANLCINARDAIESVGKITIETAAVTFDEVYCTDHPGFIPGDFVLLAVSDNGCGMDKEILDNIFEPFFTTKDVDKGTGLGMATVYGIIKQNKGFINVYSEPGKGTTIKIYLARHGAKAVEIHEKTTEEIPISRGETVLVVEDDPPILEIMQKILQGLGYTVLTSSAPEKTMGMVKEYTGKIHLLITDVIMPKMNGRDLAEQLQSICPDLKCLFMSGYTANVIAHQGILDKGVNFIQKPFTRIELAKIVRKALGEEKI